MSRRTLPKSRHYQDLLHEKPQEARAAVVCKDGFTMSVQASAYHYCSPKIHNAESYTEVEIGYPNNREPLLDKYCEGYGLWVKGKELFKDSTFKNAVYPYVPADVLIEVIMKHGGMIGGELPNLDLSNLSNNDEEE